MKKLLSYLILTFLWLWGFAWAVIAHETYDRYDSNRTSYKSSSTSSQRNKNKRTTTRQQPKIIYIYQNVPSTGYTYTSPGYPGCGRSDIVVGGQAWASCNISTRSNGSSSTSGWFFANDLRASFLSSNGQGTRLEWQGKVVPVASWGDGPCASGYRLPTRGEWETALSYARQNNVSVTTLLNLPRNGGYRGYKDSNSDVRIEARTDTAASYWSSTLNYNGGYFPTIMRIGAVYQGYRVDGTYDSYQNSGYNWQYTDNWMELISGTSSDLANIRCIRK